MATAINRWEPTNRLALRDAVNQLFEDSWVRPFSVSNSSQGNYHLPLDIFETDDAFVVKAFVPGVTADHLDITVQQNTLRIRAEQPVEQQEGVQYYLRERTGGTWYRAFQLPSMVDSSHVDAKLENGVLILTLPKAPEAKPHKIQITSS